MRIATAEIFSPVVTVTAFSSENEAVAIASGSNCGLPAGALRSRQRDRVPDGRPRRSFQALYARTLPGEPRNWC
ncbi:MULTISPECIES: aldehyde dehydrogenase family protein [unclassified Streptomyces]|uniref:aldehyde dehydrogenase family protein n=1 Tax=unclassified Streptomyces TaxID=2593676 RepID=UPI000F038214|nr:aldehyde dehydrogenase family protein [Streptomyces sp. Tu 4128]